MQIYEQYWSYTAAFTDLFGTKAVTSLKICVDFLDVHTNDLYTKELYDKLTKRNVMHKLTYKMDLQKVTEDGQITLYGHLLKMVYGAEG